MVSKNQKKLIKSLAFKKYRKQHGLFIAEGVKLINELLQQELQVQAIYTINPALFSQVTATVVTVTEQELQSLSFLKKSQQALALFYAPEYNLQKQPEVLLTLDDVQDPGNLGTLIRLCDWFGIKDVVCSLHTVDAYNPKVVQATMGSIGRVRVFYKELSGFFQTLSEDTEVYGTFMEGTSIYKTRFQKPSVFILGNEGKGISDTVSKWVTQRITIPKYDRNNQVESLNVATAGAILLNEFRRQ
ncbi:RNA methyltransferase [Aquimarina sp. ERC-38]|uniref:RNA methyltransferase n=1 Tax=Aquimarina sp. ERC-38 TaxID=2949996 RepID=UPI0022470375|nr:RNA methyltransferase [Aquimarina sp. ERC-38]UZO82548.1 RNA methyltransferase [Aquimarina sp. ERC-38]